MIPEETNPTQTTPEEPLTPTLLPDPDSHAPNEPLDDGGFTPPHGDPLGEAALDTPAASELATEVPEFATGEAVAVNDFDSGHLNATTAEDPGVPVAEPAELLYTGPVEPALAGSLITHPEPIIEPTEVQGTAPFAAEPISAVSQQTEWGTLDQVVDEPVDQVADVQPELLYAGPVEPAPAGLHFPEAAPESDETGSAFAAGVRQAFPRQPNDDLEVAALASEATAPAPISSEEPDEPIDGGPNWMLAFICAWSSAISLREAWATVGGGGLGMALRNLGVLGYLLLGVGLLAFAFDALRWGRPRRGIGPLVIPTLLTLAGVVCLVLWNDRGRPI